jgi:LacI family transcriptional regulator
MTAPFPKRILLVLDWAEPKVYSGLMRFAGSRGWLVDTGVFSNAYLGQNHYDGLIVSPNPKCPEWLLQYDIPTVFLFQTFQNHRRSDISPLILFEEENIGRLGAQPLVQLRDRPIWLFNPHANNDNPAFDLRQKGFLDHCHEQNVEVRTFEGQNLNKEGVNDARHQWYMDHLRDLPHPVSIMLLQDHDAPLVYSACGTLGLRIPEDVSIISVNDEDALCENLNPTLTSIDPGWKSIGEKAGQLIERLFQGEELKGLHHVRPEGITLRGSLHQPKSKDPLVTATLSYIQDNIDNNPSLKSISQDLGAEPRSLAKIFQTHLHCHIKDYVIDKRVSRLRQLMASGEMSSLQIAKKMNFSSEYYLYNFFKKHTGMTVKEYRKHHQKKDH